MMRRTTTDGSSSAAEAIAGSEDILTEILVRLPPKTVLSFNCVSKFWLSLISSPHFSRVHGLRHRSSLSGIFLRTETALARSAFELLSLRQGSNAIGTSFMSLNFGDDPAGVKILQSCNGLLLCCSLLRVGSTRKYHVCNPTTKRSRTVLPPAVAADGNGSARILGVNLAFDPLISPDYSIVCVRTTDHSSYHYQIEIYSSTTGEWRTSERPFVAPFDMVFHNGVFWKGAIHWISPSGSSLCFHIDRELFVTMPALPGNKGWGPRRFRYFGESGGHLHLIDIYGHRTTQFEVFEMETDYSKWFAKYQVNLDGVISRFPETVRDYLDPRDSCYYAFIILSLNREENEEDSSLLLHIPGKVLSYNLKRRTLMKLCDLVSTQAETHSSLQVGWLDSFPYIESLACV